MVAATIGDALGSLLGMDAVSTNPRSVLGDEFVSDPSERSGARLRGSWKSGYAYRHRRLHMLAAITHTEKIKIFIYIYKLNSTRHL